MGKHLMFLFWEWRAQACCPARMSCPEAHDITCCWRGFINTVHGRAKHQDFGQGSKQGKVDVLEFGSFFNVTTPIQSHWLAFGVKFDFHNAVLRVSLLLMKSEVRLGSWGGICLLQKLCFSHFAKFCFLDLLHRQNWCNRGCNEALLIVFAHDSRDFWRSSSCFPEMWVRLKLGSSLWLCLGCNLWRGLSCLTRGMLFFLPWAEILALAVIAAALLSSFLGDHSSHLLLKLNQPWAEQSQRRGLYFFQAVQMSCSNVKMLDLAAVKAMACPGDFLAPLRD